MLDWYCSALHNEGRTDRYNSIIVGPGRNCVDSTPAVEYDLLLLLYCVGFRIETPSDAQFTPSILPPVDGSVC